MWKSHRRRQHQTRNPVAQNRGLEALIAEPPPSIALLTRWRVLGLSYFHFYFSCITYSPPPIRCPTSLSRTSPALKASFWLRLMHVLSRPLIYYFFTGLPWETNERKGELRDIFFVRADREYLLLVVLSRCVCMKVYLHWSRAFRLSMVVCSWHRIASVVVRVRDGTTLQETGGRKLMVRSVRTPACAFQGGKGALRRPCLRV